jgi:hypothetical protein
VVSSSSSSCGKAYLPPPPLSPVWLLPWCDPQSRDVPNDILPESLVSSPGVCWTGCPKRRAHLLAGTTAATTTIVSITIVKPTSLRTTNTQVCIVALIHRSITSASVMLVHGD